MELWIDLFGEHQILDHASAIAFQVLKALVPLTLLGLAILGALGQEKVWRQTLFPGIKPHVQPATAHAIDVAVQKIFTSNSAGLIAFASFLVIWYVSGSVRAVISGINGIYEAEERRSWKVRYAISFSLAIAIAICVVGSVVVVAAGPALARGGAVGVVVSIGRWLVGVTLLSLAVGLLVRYAPAERRSKRWATAGSVLVIGAWIVASVPSSIIFLVGVQLDELLREDARRGERGVLHVLFGYGR